MNKQNEDNAMETVKGHTESYVEHMSRYGKRVIRLNGFDDKVLNAEEASKFLASLQKGVDWAKGKKKSEE